MSETLIHRGPDAEGTFVKGGVGLASRRLAIIDLAGGDQPISNEDGSCTVVQNGEIYNYAELNHSLERAGHTLRTRSDTETIVHAYEEWDLGFAERLRGMFAIAIWDARRKRLVLARDRFGIKPLYYRDVGGELSFASELDALPKGDLDLDALEAFLATNTVPTPLSIFREIRKLPPGHVLTWEDGKVALERFARPGPLPVRVDDEAELLEECRARLRDSVRAHLVSDVPVGVLLSGGVDSGTSRGARLRGELGAGAHVLDRVRGAVVRRARRAHGRSRSATGRAIASSCCDRTRRCSSPRWPTRSTSRSRTPRRYRPTSSRGSRPRT